MPPHGQAEGPKGTQTGRRGVAVAVAVWVVLLGLATLASAQTCSGVTPNDVCERRTPGTSPGKGYEPALPPSAEKVATAVLDAVDGIVAYVTRGQAISPVLLSTPAVQVNATGEIHVYVILSQFKTEHVAQLEALGLRVELTLPEFRLIQAWIPATLVDVVAGLDFVEAVRPPGYGVVKSGAQTTQGDSILGAVTARSAFRITGEGVTVGVISDGADNLGHSIASGDLPGSVEVLKPGEGDEGTAMMEIIHDVAPGAGLVFYSPTTSADMVAGINALAAAGARIVVDDLLFLDEPKFEDGMIAKVARSFATGGKVYVTSAGNEAMAHYRSSYRRLTGQGFPSASYPAVHNYASNGIDFGNTVVLPSGCSIVGVLQWNNRNGTAADDFDLIVGRTDDLSVLAQSAGIQTGTQNAYEIATYTNTTGAELSVFLAIAEWRLTSPAASRVLDYFVYSDCLVDLQFVTSADSVIGHAAVNEVLSVATVNASTPTEAAPYSSRGPASISFPSPETRAVPNITGVDCVSTQTGVAGFFFQPFCGTSAAASHVAGIAALVMGVNPQLTSQQIRNALTSSAFDLGPPGFDHTFGAGRVDAMQAVRAVAGTVTVSFFGTGAGTVTSVPAGIDCDATCSAAFPMGAAVTLTATPAAGSTFLEWTAGKCQETGTGLSPCTITAEWASGIGVVFVPDELPAFHIEGPQALVENSTFDFVPKLTFSDGSVHFARATWSVTAPATIALNGSFNGRLTIGEVAATTTVTITASYRLGTRTLTATKVVTIQDTTSGLGYVEVTDFYDVGLRRSGPVSFTLRGPDGSTRTGVAPRVFADMTAGQWSITSVTGGPPGAVLLNPVPLSGRLNNGGGLPFVLFFVCPAATSCGGGPLVTLDRTTAPLTGPLVARLANGPGVRGEWVGVYPAGSSGSGGYVDWQWSSGGQTAAQATTNGPLTFPTGGRALPAGTYVLRWWAANGALLAQSANVTLADVPGTPSLTVLEPASVVAGSPGFTLRARGSGFRPTSTIQIGGTPRTTTFVSATELSAAITASEIGSTGTLTLTVLTPAIGGAGGGTSTPITLPIVAPPAAPTVTSLSPTSANVGGGTLVLTVNGANYVPSSVVQVNGVARATTFVSQTRLTAVLTADDLALAQVLSVAIRTPAPGGGISSAKLFTVVGPTLAVDRTTAGLDGPLIVSLANGPALRGEWVGLYPVGAGAYADWQWSNGGQNGSQGVKGATLVFPSGGRSLPPGNYVARWWAAGSGLLAQSATFTLIDLPPLPVLTTLEPASVIAGGATFTLEVRGSGFRPSSLIQFGGTTRPTTFVNAELLTTVVPASDISAVATRSVTVFTPPINGLGGGTSRVATLTITPPPATPTLISTSPTSVAVGASGTAITLTGTNYVASSVGRVNGSARPTTLLSSTQLRIVLAAADVASGGTLSVSVVTPAPGGGTSSALNLSVVGPTLSVDRAMASLTGPVVVTIASGPGLSGEWIGVYPVGTGASGGYADWQWSNGGQGTIQPSANSALVFPTGGRALPAGIYVARWWSAGSTLIAQSAAFTLADIPPPPTIETLAPATVVAGSSGFTLRVRGAGFRDSTVIRIGAADRVTTFVSATEVTTSIAASEIAAVGILTVTVRTPSLAGQGGGTSGAATLTVTPQPARPTLTGISPTTVAMGTLDVPITATGTNYVASSVIHVNGVARPTTFISATQLMIRLVPEDMAFARALDITVVTPAPGGGTSTSATLTVVGPSVALDRAITSLTGPVVATFSNGPGRSGEWFGIYPVGTTGAGGYVDWQWTGGGQSVIQALPSGAFTFPTGGRALPAGQYVVRWWSASSALLAQSAVVTLADMPPSPTIASLEPESVVAGSGAFALRVRGSGFRSNTTIQVGGSARVTTFESATEVSATIAANEIASAGTLSITVVTPALGGQGGGTSGAKVLSITPPPAVPVLANVAPTSVGVGVAGPIVTATGANFVRSSVIQVNGTPRATTFVSATQLTATLTAADVSSGGTLSVTVLTPAPGGGTSSVATVTVVGPSLTIDKTSAPLSGPIVATTANGPGLAGEWLGLYPAGSTGTGGYLDWQWSNGGQNGAQPSASSVLPFPTGGRTLPAGSYVLRWWAAGGALLAQSVAFSLVDIAPTPVLHEIVPRSAVAGSPAFDLRLQGTGFHPTSVVRVDGKDRPTTFVGSTALVARISASDVAAVGTLSILVSTPAVAGQGGGTSVAKVFSMTPGPTLAVTMPSLSELRVVVTLANGPGIAGEWVGIYPAGVVGASGYLDWQWSNGGKQLILPATGSALSFPTAPGLLTEGSYVARWWAQDGRLLAEDAFSIISVGGLILTTAPMPIPSD